MEDSLEDIRDTELSGYGDSFSHRDLPDGVKPMAFMPPENPADQPRPKKRKALSELVSRENW